MIFTRELIEKYNVDVFIAGGGPAAALAAEKEETRSIQISELQEKNRFDWRLYSEQGIKAVKGCLDDTKINAMRVIMNDEQRSNGQG